MSVDSGAGTTWESNVVDVTFAVADPSPPLASPEPPIAAAAPRAPDEPAVRVPAVPARRSRSTVETSQAPPQEREPASPTPSESELMLALDPNTAARAFIVSQRVAPSEVSDAKREGPDAAEAGPRNYFEGVGDKQHLSVREPPKLRRHKDGTHRYKGHAFKAIVEKDGSVTFDEGYGQGLTLRFDVADAIMRRRGEDPYRVEKNWFLEGTEEFRQELFERWQAKQTILAIRKLRVQLLRLFENEALSGNEKAARVIALFQDTSDDEAGALARNTITEFVADRMPGVELPIDLR
ncbi:MAG: hypothetical protein WBM48_10765 [Polyangiales bacterium]